ncbi:MAG TPA: TRAP transporter small permease subunit, partial [Clostridia bacterium]|nr:TRAP transporter small permease subunit [Clostridia bacterium]
WLVFLSIAITAKNNGHVRCDFFNNLYPKKFRRFIEEFGKFISLFFLAVCIWITPKLIEVTKDSIAPTLNVPVSIVFVGMLIGFIFTFIFELFNLLELLGKTDKIDLNIDNDANKHIN